MATQLVTESLDTIIYGIGTAVYYTQVNLFKSYRIYTYVYTYIHRLNGYHDYLTDYSPGPYNVTIKKNRWISETFFIDIVPDNDEHYTGNQSFTLNIDINALNSGLVPCVDKPSTVVDIVDNECK